MEVAFMAWHLLARYLVGLAFLTSGITKGLKVGDFEANLDRYSLLPMKLVRPAARLIVLAELVAGGLMLFGIATKWASLLAAVLLAFFTLAIGVKLVQRQEIPCGCGGLFNHRISRWHILRNGFVLGLTVWLGVTAPDLPEPTLMVGIHVISISLAVGLLLCLAFIEELVSIRLMIARWSSVRPERAQ